MCCAWLMCCVGHAGCYRVTWLTCYSRLVHGLPPWSIGNLARGYFPHDKHGVEVSQIEQKCQASACSTVLRGSVRSTGGMSLFQELFTSAPSTTSSLFSNANRFKSAESVVINPAAACPRTEDAYNAKHAATHMQKSGSSVKRKRQVEQNQEASHLLQADGPPTQGRSKSHKQEAASKRQGEQPAAVEPKRKKPRQVAPTLKSSITSAADPVAHAAAVATAIQEQQHAAVSNHTKASKSMAKSDPEPAAPSTKHKGTAIQASLHAVDSLSDDDDADDDGMDDSVKRHQPTDKPTTTREVRSRWCTTCSYVVG